MTTEQQRNVLTAQIASIEEEIREHADGIARDAVRISQSITLTPGANVTLPDLTGRSNRIWHLTGRRRAYQRRLAVVERELAAQEATP